MLIDLFDILQEDKCIKEYTPSISFDAFKINNDVYPISDYKLVLKFEKGEKKHIVFTANGYVKLKMNCDKCLEEVEHDIIIDYFKDLDMSKTSYERIADLDEISYLDNTVFDFDNFIYNEILVNLPMKVLCKDNCKGICNRCGANLNKGSCQCENAELDPRMSKILDVFNQFKEV